MFICIVLHVLINLTKSEKLDKSLGKAGLKISTGFFTTKVSDSGNWFCVCTEGTRKIRKENSFKTALNVKKIPLAQAWSTNQVRSGKMDLTALSTPLSPFKVKIGLNFTLGWCFANFGNSRWINASRVISELQLKNYLC